ncbi:MAG: NAD(P)-binding domain-containing protein [Bryobacteraceae bacterium]
MLELIFLEGSRQGTAIRLTFEKAWFGRQPTCDFVLDGSTVSNAHFYLLRREADYVLIDNKSTNGTFVNGVRTLAVPLRAGDRIAAGSHVMQIREVVEPASLPFRFIAVQKNGERVSQIIEQTTILLGRKNICQVQLNEPSVSPVHAQMERRQEGIWITDESSEAGVYVNGQRVVTQQLRHGDLVTIRPFEITIALTEEICVLEVKDCSSESKAEPKDLPANYRDVVTAPQRRDAGESKPSATIAARPIWAQSKAPIWVPTSDILPNLFRSRILLISVVAVLALAAYAFTARRYGFYSPGPTAKVHSTANAVFVKRLEQYEVSSECAACHSGFARVQNDSCNVCHADTHATKIHDGQGLTCVSCHSEHKGPQFDIARNVGGGCQASGCHTSVHEKPKLILARQRRPEGVNVVVTVAFEAPFRKSGDELHVQHADLKDDCASCHIDGDNPKIKTPRDMMRMRCLGCHGFGPEATLRERCYSCHFEHPTKKPEKILAAMRFTDVPSLNSMGPSGSRFGRVLLLFIAVVAAVPLLYFAAITARFHFDQRLRSRTGASSPIAGPAAAAGRPTPAEPEASLSAAMAASAVAEPKPTDNQAPGGNLRPQIDLDLCVGCGSCVHVCPFNVLEIVNEKAIAARLVDCTGYAACAAECPTGAITLVSGGAMQTVELPVYDTSLETNVPGLYLAGEVTGKALIKIAINQGKRVVESILSRPPEPGDQFDVIVVGAGPAGASAALAAKKEGMKVLVLEQGTTANTIRNYPRQKFVMAEPVLLPVYGPLWMEDSSKEALIERWQEIIASTGLEIHEEEKVLSVVRYPGCFLVQSTKGEYQGRRVVLAIGQRGSPRKLGVPGEDSAKVAYNLLDADAYHGKAICVVGGGDSGIEASNGLARPDLENRVCLVHRLEDFSRAKPRNQKKVRKSMDDGRLKAFFNSGVVEIRDRSVLVQTAAQVEEIENDFVFVMIGGEAPKKFLTECGIKFSNRPLG